MYVNFIYKHICKIKIKYNAALHLLGHSAAYVTMEMTELHKFYLFRRELYCSYTTQDYDSISILKFIKYSLMSFLWILTVVSSQNLCRVHLLVFI